MISIETMTESYDWNAAFEHNPEGWQARVVHPEQGPLNERVTWGFADIQQILALQDGARDEESWIALLWLNDGRYVFVTAGCDYTGWDC